MIEIASKHTVKSTCQNRKLKENSTNCGLFRNSRGCMSKQEEWLIEKRFSWNFPGYQVDTQLMTSESIVLFGLTTTQMTLLTHSPNILILCDQNKQVISPASHFANESQGFAQALACTKVQFGNDISSDSLEF